MGPEKRVFNSVIKWGREAQDSPGVLKGETKEKQHIKLSKWSLRVADRERKERSSAK
jgi:hypothetical protein